MNMELVSEKYTSAVWRNMKLCDLTDLSSVFAIIDLSCSVVLN
jgi:hypothetical protein